MPFGTILVRHIFPQPFGDVVGFYKLEAKGTCEQCPARITSGDNPLAEGDLVAYDCETARFGIIAKNVQPATAIPISVRGRFQGYEHVLTSSLSAETLANVARARSIWKV